MKTQVDTRLTRRNRRDTMLPHGVALHGEASALRGMPHVLDCSYAHVTTNAERHREASSNRGCSTSQLDVEESLLLIAANDN